MNKKRLSSSHLYHSRNPEGFRRSMSRTETKTKDTFLMISRIGTVAFIMRDFQDSKRACLHVRGRRILVGVCLAPSCPRQQKYNDHLLSTVSQYAQCSTDREGLWSEVCTPGLGWQSRRSVRKGKMKTLVGRAANQCFLNVQYITSPA